jgi:hypothetical protein
MVAFLLTSGALTGAVTAMAGTVRVSVSTSGAQADATSGEWPGIPAVDASGRFVAFSAWGIDGTSRMRLYWHDRDADADGIFDEPGAVRTTTLEHLGYELGGEVIRPTWSANGRFLAFTRFVSIEEEFDPMSVVLLDRDADGDGTFDEAGAVNLSHQTNADCALLSADGRFLAYQLQPPQDNDLVLLDRASGKRTLLQIAPHSYGQSGCSLAGMSASGRFLTFDSSLKLVAADSNQAADVFVFDRKRNRVRRVSVSTRGSQGRQDSGGGSISRNGRFVVFATRSSSVVPNDGNRAVDVFVRDRDTDRDGIYDEPRAVATRLISKASNGEQGNEDSRSGTVSPNGRFIAFVSDATNLVAGDTNGIADVFVRDRDTDEDGIFDEPGGARTFRISVASDGSEANDSSDGFPPPGAPLGVIRYPAMTNRYAAFTSLASNLVEADTNSRRDVFVYGPLP